MAEEAAEAEAAPAPTDVTAPTAAAAAAAAAASLVCALLGVKAVARAGWVGAAAGLVLVTLCVTGSSVLLVKAKRNYMRQTFGL